MAQLKRKRYTGYHWALAQHIEPGSTGPKEKQTRGRGGDRIVVAM